MKEIQKKYFLDTYLKKNRQTMREYCRTWGSKELYREEIIDYREKYHKCLAALTNSLIQLSLVLTKLTLIILN